MATVSDHLAEARERIDLLVMDSTARTQLIQSLNAIDRAVTAGREKVSLALTILRDPAMASRPAHAIVAAADLLEEALALLDGTQEPTP